MPSDCAGNGRLVRQQPLSTISECPTVISKTVAEEAPPQPASEAPDEVAKLSIKSSLQSLHIRRLEQQLAEERQRTLAAEEAQVRADLLTEQAETKARNLQYQLQEQRRLLADREKALVEHDRARLRAEGDRKNLQASLDRANATLAKLRNSVSWRITLPVRAVARALVRARAWIIMTLLRARRLFHTKRADIRLIRHSGLFDADYYLRQYPEVARSGMDPVVHYLEIGAMQGKNPSPYFDTVYYARQMEKRYAHAADVRG